MKKKKIIQIAIIVCWIILFVTSCIKGEFLESLLCFLIVITTSLNLTLDNAIETIERGEEDV